MTLPCNSLSEKQRSENTHISRTWDFITCEYPPEIGGLSDYTRQLAEYLAKGEYRVDVWAPGLQASEQVSNSLAVHRCFNRFGLKDLFRMDNLWKLQGTKRNIFLQWVPSGYGFDSLNVFFCLWLLLQVVRGHHLCVMFHEFGYNLSERKFHLKIAGLIHRAMATLLLSASCAAFASCMAVANRLKSYNFCGRRIEVLPVPSNIGRCLHSEDLRSRYAESDELLVGHFGQFSPRIESLLIPSLGLLLSINPKVKILFIGDGSDRYHAALALNSPDLSSRSFGTGSSSVERIASFISTCDCMFQPYQDGVSARRGSAMAALRNGRLLVCTESKETEDAWRRTPAVHLINSYNPEQIAVELASVVCSPERLAHGCAEAHEFYEANFSINKTIAALQLCAQSLNL